MAVGLVVNRRRQVPAEDSPAFGAIAERFRRAGELERAVALCEEGLQKFPDHLSARVTLGWALIDLGRHREARSQLEGVLRRAPDNLAAIRGLAQLHDSSNESDGESEMPHPSVWQPVETVEAHAAPPMPPEPRHEVTRELEIETAISHVAPPHVTHAPVALPELELYTGFDQSSKAATPATSATETLSMDLSLAPELGAFEAIELPSDFTLPARPSSDVTVDVAADIAKVVGKDIAEPEPSAAFDFSSMAMAEPGAAELEARTGERDAVTESSAVAEDSAAAETQASTLNALERFLKRVGKSRTEVSSDERTH